MGKAITDPYGGHPEFGPRVMANQAHPSIAGWEALAKDALLAWEDCRGVLAVTATTTVSKERQRIRAGIEVLRADASLAQIITLNRVLTLIGDD